MEMTGNGALAAENGALAYGNGPYSPLVRAAAENGANGEGRNLGVGGKGRFFAPESSAGMRSPQRSRDMGAKRHSFSPILLRK
jgi:hypothetical protein